MTQVMDPPALDSATQAPEKLHGIIAEFETVNDIMHAAKKTRDEGFKHWDVHSPFPVHGIDAAMGIRPTILPWVVLICGITGTILGLALTIGTMATAIRNPSFIISSDIVAAVFFAIVNGLLKDLEEVRGGLYLTHRFCSEAATSNAPKIEILPFTNRMLIGVPNDM